MLITSYMNAIYVGPTASLDPNHVIVTSFPDHQEATISSTLHGPFGSESTPTTPQQLLNTIKMTGFVDKLKHGASDFIDA